MKPVLLVGATGLVGGQLLQQLAEHGDYDVTTVGRRSPDLQHPHVSHQVSEFDDSLSLPTGQTLYCCLGTTIRKAGSREAFRAIDLQLVSDIAAAAVENGYQTGIFVSSVGADPKSSNFYLRTKGEMEETVSSIGFERCGILQPSLLLGARNEFRPGEQLGKFAAALINPLLLGGLTRYRAITAGTVAASMIGLDRSEFSGTRVLAGNEILLLARSVS